MDRLETKDIKLASKELQLFTFQYGQIRNIYNENVKAETALIYIPVWIDQKQRHDCISNTNHRYLHSSMDRLETYSGGVPDVYSNRFTFQYGQIRN